MTERRPDLPDDQTDAGPPPDDGADNDDDGVDEAGKESFPASDPPAWNLGRVSGGVR